MLLRATVSLLTNFSLCLLLADTEVLFHEYVFPMLANHD
jgi:hypothetical protein